MHIHMVIIWDGRKENIVVNNTCDLKINVSKYALAGGLYVSASSWQDPPQGPPNNLKGCGGGVNLPMNYRKNDAKTAMTIGALDLKREQINVYQNCSDPP